MMATVFRLLREDDQSWWPILCPAKLQENKLKRSAVTDPQWSNVCTSGRFRGFPGGSAVKNLLAIAGNTGSVSDLGRSHMLRMSWAHAPRLLSLCSRAPGPQLLKPLRCRAHALRREKPPRWEACILQHRVASTLTREQPSHSSEDPAQPGAHKIIFKKIQCTRKERDEECWKTWKPLGISKLSLTVYKAVVILKK